MSARKNMLGFRVSWPPVTIFLCAILLAYETFTRRRVHEILSLESDTSKVLISGNDGSCARKFVRYQASDLETSWYTAISSLKSNDPKWTKGCAKAAAEESISRKMLAELKRHANDRRVQLSGKSFSYHVYVDTCTGEQVKQYIEPLVSFLRHPLSLCVEQSIFDKSYLLLLHEEELDIKSSYKWLFDAGASTYDTGAGGASQSWFVDNYRGRGIDFDRIIGWEAAPTEPITQWGPIPADVKQKTSWYNIPISSEVGGADNPLTFIKNLTRKEDFVVLKLDIDTPVLEIEIVRQIMRDPELWALIDEFYFEHHVSGSPMQWNGWGDLTSNDAPLGDIEDSYEIFRVLREKGIRAHSWV